MPSPPSASASSKSARSRHVRSRAILRPRLFRVPQAQALINRMGFNNLGVDRLVHNVSRARYRGILGINIGKNFDTPIERAAADYLACMRKAYPLASYLTVNISSPNTTEPAATAAGRRAGPPARDTQG